MCVGVSNRAKKCVRNWSRTAQGRDRQTRVRAPLNKEGQGTALDTGLFDACVYWLECAKKRVRYWCGIVPGRERLTKLRSPLWQGKGRELREIRVCSKRMCSRF